MNNTLREQLVSEKLADLHRQAIAQLEQEQVYRLSVAERFMAVSAEQGQYLNFMVGLTKAQHIVEFGCSFGISGIYLASAAKDNGGSVITTELEASKGEIAWKNFADVNLDGFIEVRIGDALQTLSNVERVDFLFLDGAKELYFPVYKLLYPKLSTDAVVIADNIDKKATHDLVDHLRSADEFRTISLFDGRMLVAYRRGLK